MCKFAKTVSFWNGYIYVSTILLIILLKFFKFSAECKLLMTVIINKRILEKNTPCSCYFDIFCFGTCMVLLHVSWKSRVVCFRLYVVVTRVQNEPFVNFLSVWFILRNHVLTISCKFLLVIMNHNIKVWKVISDIWETKFNPKYFDFSFAEICPKSPLMPHCKVKFNWIKLKHCKKLYDIIRILNLFVSIALLHIFLYLWAQSPLLNTISWHVLLSVKMFPITCLQRTHHCHWVVATLLVRCITEKKKRWKVA